jgi:hypothetical protein
MFPGKDYYNPMVNPMEDVNIPFIDLVDRRCVFSPGVICVGVCAASQSNDHAC